LRAVAWLAGVARSGGRAARAGEDPVARALAAFAGDWTRRATPLYAARAARILHVAAAALALGVIASLYVRGLALEYRATWESTFLDASAVRTVVSLLYAPGALVTRLLIPDAAHIAAIRSPASENAALWLHLMAATLLAVVMVPRLALALGATLVERYRAAHLQDEFADAYCQRLLRGFHQGPVTVQAIPYSFAVSPAAAAALEALLARSLGGNVTLVVAPAVAYGDDEVPAAALRAGDHAPRVALFNATATPEHEVHGPFVEALAAGGRQVVVVVDESSFNARGRDDAKRREDRRALWRELCADQHLVPVFVDLAQPDVDAAEAAFDAAFEGPPA
jgi:hypothetical protein